MHKKKIILLYCISLTILELFSLFLLIFIPHLFGKLITSEDWVSPMHSLDNDPNCDVAMVSAYLGNIQFCKHNFSDDFAQWWLGIFWIFVAFLVIYLFVALVRLNYKLAKKRIYTKK